MNFAGVGDRNDINSGTVYRWIGIGKWLGIRTYRVYSLEWRWWATLLNMIHCLVRLTLWSSIRSHVYKTRSYPQPRGQLNHTAPQAKKQNEREVQKQIIKNHVSSRKPYSTSFPYSGGRFAWWYLTSSQPSMHMRLRLQKSGSGYWLDAVQPLQAELRGWKWLGGSYREG